MAASKTLKARIANAAKSFDDWQLVTSKPKLGEICLEYHSGSLGDGHPYYYKVKIGDNVSTYAELPYFGDLTELTGSCEVVRWNTTGSTLDYYKINQANGRLYLSDEPYLKVRVSGSNLAMTGTTTGGVTTVELAHTGTSPVATSSVQLDFSSSFEAPAEYDEHGHVTKVRTFRLPTSESIDAVSTSIAAVSTSLGQVSSSVVSLSSSLDQISGTVTEHWAEFGLVSQSYYQFSGSASVQLTNLSSSLTAVSGTVTTLSGSVGTLSSSLATVSGTLDQVSSSVVTLSSSFRSFSSSVSSSLATIEDELVDQAADIDHISGTVVSMSGILNTVTGSVHSLETFSGSINSYTSSINLFTSSINTFTGSVSSSVVGLETEVGNISGTLQTVSSSFNSVSSSVSSSLNSLDTKLTNVSSSFVNVSSSVSSSLNSLTSKVNTVSGTLGQVSASVATLSDTTTELSSSVATISGTLGTVSSSLGNVSSSFANTSASVATSLTNLSSSLATTSGTLGTVSSSLVNVSSSFVSVSSSVSSSLANLSSSIGAVSTNVTSSISASIADLNSSVHTTTVAKVLTSVTQSAGKLTGIQETEIKAGDGIGVTGSAGQILINHGKINTGATNVSGSILTDSGSYEGERTLDIITGISVDDKGHVIHIDRDKSTNLIAADIKAPVVKQDNSTWNFRKTGGDITIGEDTAKIPVLKGNTIVWNQAVSQNVIITDNVGGWKTFDSNTTVTSGGSELQILKSSGYGIAIYTLHENTIISGHIYYLAADIKTTAPDNSITINAYAVDTIIDFGRKQIASNSWQRLASVRKCISAAASSQQFRITDTRSNNC